MSRTGVGVRVVIDGKQLDDGCFPWSGGYYGPPWTVTRTNLHINPRADTAGAIAGAFVNSVAGNEMGSWGPGIAGFPSSRRNTRQNTAGAFAWRVVITEYFGNATYRIRAVIRPSVSAASALLYMRPDVLSATNQGPGVEVGPLVAGQEKTIDVLATTANAAAAANPGFAVVMPSSPIGSFIEGAGVIAERNGTVGDSYFDGVTLDDGAYAFDWTGTPNASTSTQSEGTWTSGVPGNVIPEGLSADEGLKIVWGRANTVEQPSPSTCTFKVTDTVENLYYQNFRIGSDVRIYADATVSGGATLPAFADPDFETEVRAVTRNSVVGRDSRHVETGTVAAVMKPINANALYSAQFPPSTLQTPGSNPNAWDNLPHLSPGETWHLSVRVWVPEYLTVTARPVIYTGPYANAATALDPIGVATTPGWNTLEADVSPGVQLGWMGVQLDATNGLEWGSVPEEWTWQSVPAEMEWRDLTDVYLDRVEILAPEGGTNLTILVFGGRITDMASAWEGASPALDVTATDFLGDLGNRYVGDEPWLLEPLATRVLRVLALARAGNEPVITADIAPTYTNVPVSWDDVDHRAASGILIDLANSVDGVLWSATHLVTGPYVKIEDPGTRPALYQLALENDYIIIETIDPETIPVDQRPLDLSACDVLRDPVEFVLDVADIATRAAVTWREQTTDEEGNPSPTDRTLSVIDVTDEIEFGTRNISLQTLLTTPEAAVTVAERLLARQTGQWRMTGLRVADADFNVPDATAINILTTLLNGVRRGGLPVRVTDLPSWSPIGDTAPAYVEGGEYTYIGGGWELNLTISRGTGLGRNAQWDEIPPTWTWDQWSPGITWDALRGVAAPGNAL